MPIFPLNFDNFRSKGWMYEPNTFRGASCTFVSLITAPVSGEKVTEDLPPLSKSTIARDRLSAFSVTCSGFMVVAHFGMGHA